MLGQSDGIQNGGGAEASLIKETTTADFRVDVIAESARQPVLVDFWAPWCGPCKMFAPTFAQLAKKYTNQVLFVKLNTEEEQSIAAQFGIRSIPTLAFFKGGQEINRLSGALGLGDLDRYIQQQLFA